MTDVDIDMDGVRRALRIRPGSKVETKFVACVEELVDELHASLSLSSVWNFFPNEFTGFPAGLRRYPQVVLVAVTAGPAISEKLSEMSKRRELFKMNVLDAMVNAALSLEQRRADGEFRSVAHQRGLRLSRRFSPGCPHMSMSQLPVMVDALASTVPMKVTCTSAEMLTPAKSLVYAHGAAATLSTDQPTDFCDTCRKTACIRSRRNHDHP